MAYVLVTHPLPGKAIHRLKQYHRVEILSAPFTKDLLIRKVKDAEGIIPLLSHRIDKKVLEGALKLKIIANYAVGYDNIDMEEAKKRGIVITNTPDVLTEATADLTWALILACARRIVQADRFVREGRFQGWEPNLFLGMDLTGKTLGIIGMGRIGQAVARRALGFNMRVAYYQRHPLDPQKEKRFNLTYLPLETLLKESDIVSLHLPLTQESYYLLNKKRLTLMKPGAILINTARGAIVEEEGLMELLEKGHLRYAGLDVYEKEPKIPQRLISLPQTVLLPHIGSAGEETRAKMADLAVDNVLAVLRGDPPLTPVV